MLQFAAASSAISFAQLTIELGPALFAIGWLVLVAIVGWIAWSVYMLVIQINYISAIEWTYLQVTVPPDSEETPKNMEIAFEVLAGMHKSPDLVERYFDGYFEPWFSCEVFCTTGNAKYVMVVPTAHRKLVEGVLYGQYPRAEIKEVQDHALKYDWRDIRRTFDLYGTEMLLAEDDIYPIRTYLQYETPLADEDKFADPHQALIEAFTHVSPGEEFWLQMCVRPQDAENQVAWSTKGQDEVAVISGQASEESPGLLSQMKDFLLALPGELFSAFANGPVEAGDDKKDQQFKFFNPVDEARMKGILQKVQQSGFRVKIRVLHIAPAGQLVKPNVGRAIGVFKQFNTFNLNSFKPDPETKSNGPNFIFRDVRRAFRERQILLHFQWRDMFGDEAGMWMVPEEMATVYHFPTKFVKTPGLERAKSGRQSPPDNLPYA